MMREIPRSENEKVPGYVQLAQPAKPVKIVNINQKIKLLLFLRWYSLQLTGPLHVCTLLRVHPTLFIPGTPVYQIPNHTHTSQLSMQRVIYLCALCHDDTQL